MLCDVRSFHVFCTGELCSGRVSIKLLPYYTFFLENKLVEGKEKSTAQSTKGNRAKWTGIERQILSHYHSVDLR